jgi:PAS domain S-box-containing protein
VGTVFRVRVPLGTSHLPHDRLASEPASTAEVARARAFVEEAVRWLPDAPVSASITVDLDQKALGSAQRREGRVLLADDNADLREYVRGLLSAIGYQVEIAVDGEAALAMIRSDPPDLVLTDVMMPRLDGFGLLAAIRADPQLVNLPVIMLSARAGEEAQVEGLDAGADDYLAKPFSARELLARVSSNLTMARVRKQAADAVRLSEARLAIEREFLATVLAKAPVGILIADLNGRVLKINERGVDLIGRRYEAQAFADFVGYRAVHPDGRLYAADEYPTVRAIKGERIEGERVTFMPGGSAKKDRIVLQVDSAPIRDADGQLAGAVTVFEDASVRDRAEAELRKRVAERTRERDRAWNNSQDLLLVIGSDGFVGAANPAWKDVLGWSVREVIGRHILEFVVDDDLPASEKALSLATHEVLRRFENRLRHKDGSARSISWIATPDDGFIYATGRDVTAERQTMDALRAAEARIRSVFETTYQFQGFLTPEGKLLDANPASLAAIGKPLGEVQGQFFWETPWFAETPGMPQLVKDDVTVAASGQTVRREIIVNLPDGERCFDLSMRPVIDNWGRIIGIVPEAMELTEQRRTEEALHQAQKMEAVGQLTGGIAHDFNNMLAVVMGSLELLNRRLGADDPRARRYVSAAMDGAKRATTLTQRLLAFSRQQPLKPEPLDCNKLVSGMSDLLHHSIGADVRLEVVLAGSLWRIHADPNQLENVIVNLAVNARDAMPGGGRLTIETQNAYLDDRYAATHPGVAPGQYVLIAVSDTGSGMPPEVAAKAFDPFFTTKEVGKGTGLGLSQVYGFVKQSGGHVKIYSEPGQGTSVKTYLPRYNAPDVEAAVSETVSEVPLGDSQELMLVVEDEPGVRLFTVEMLSELGYRVLEADGAAAALRLIQAHPDIALMFTDLIMPDVNGRQLATQARRVRPDLKILFTTGYTRNAVVHNGVLDQGVELITKPFTIEDLAAKIRYMLDTPNAAIF